MYPGIGIEAADLALVPADIFDQTLKGKEAFRYQGLIRHLRQFHNNDKQDPSQTQLEGTEIPYCVRRKSLKGNEEAYDELKQNPRFSHIKKKRNTQRGTMLTHIRSDEQIRRFWWKHHLEANNVQL